MLTRNITAFKAEKRHLKQKWSFNKNKLLKIDWIKIEYPPPQKKKDFA